MLCAHTIRRLKPGTLEQFEDAFRPAEEDLPAGWIRFHLLKGLVDENEIVTFGFFDGTLEELERSQSDGDYESRRAAIEPYVDAVIANGVYEVEVSVQETWLGVVRGLSEFEERSSLRTWIFRILVNRARTRGARDARNLPFSALEQDDRPAVEPTAFAADARWASFEAHLAECDGCAGYLEDMRRLVGSLGEVAEPAPDPGTREALVRAFRDLRGPT